MPSEEFHLERYHKHRKWMRFHGVITGISIATVVGLLWAWIFAIRAYQHRSNALEHKAEAGDAE
jgi:hypothetical protein